MAQDDEKTRSDNQLLLSQKEQLNSQITSLKENYEQSRLLMEQSLADLETKCDLETKNYYKKSQEEYAHEYLLAIRDMKGELASEIDKQLQKRKELQQQINDFTEKINVIVQYNKKQQEENDKIDFYRLQLSPIEVEEIKKLREVSSILRDPLPLNKVIYQMYYKNAYTDLIGRVVGNEKITGIYKITNLHNKMCYIGQAVDIANRWKTHIKKGVGAEASTNNKLYPAMLKDGVENFTFEILDKCLPEQLNERELYWQEVFKAKEFGYSIR